MKGALSAEQTFLCKLFLSRNKEEFSHFILSSVAEVAHPHQPLPSTCASFLLCAAPGSSDEGTDQVLPNKRGFLPDRFPPLSKEPLVPAPCCESTGSVTGWLWTSDGGGQRQLSLRWSHAAAERENLTSVRSESKFHEIPKPSAKNYIGKRVPKVSAVLNSLCTCKY